MDSNSQMLWRMWGEKPKPPQSNEIFVRSWASSNGDWDAKYRVTYYNVFGESEMGPESLRILKQAGSIPYIGRLPPLPVPSNVQGRKVYRSFAGGPYTLVATIDDPEANGFWDNKDPSYRPSRWSRFWPF